MGNDDVVDDGDYVDDGDDYDGDNGDYEMIRNLWSVFVGESHQDPESYLIEGRLLPDGEVDCF